MSALNIRLSESDDPVSQIVVNSRHLLYATQARDGSTVTLHYINGNETVFGDLEPGEADRMIASVIAALATN
jgi:hypothetical protein